MARENHGPALRVELVGIAGVGKSHMKQQLLAALGDRCVDLVSFRLSLRHLPHLPNALRRCAPLVWLVLTAASGRLLVRARVSLRLVVYAWREDAAARLGRPSRFVLSEEGWFHKLRRLRQFLEPDTTYGKLPESVRTRLLQPDLVLFLTADPMVVCERKLRRWGIPVTREELVLQYARSDAMGQWREDRFTRIDLRQAAEETRVRYVEIEYDDRFDVSRELLPLLERLRSE